MIKKYKTKTREVEAVVWTGENIDEMKKARSINGDT